MSIIRICFRFIARRFAAPTRQVSGYELGWYWWPWLVAGMLAMFILYAIMGEGATTARIGMACWACFAIAGLCRIVPFMRENGRRPRERTTDAHSRQSADEPDKH